MISNGFLFQTRQHAFFIKNVFIPQLSPMLKKYVFIFNHKEKFADFMEICAEQSPECSSTTSIQFATQQM